jgi:hypothetical protein
MASGDPVPSVTEADATGEIASLYADIRQTLGVPLVNLIWRNLATIPGALDWAWSSLKPVYEDGSIQAEAYALRVGQTLPDVSSLDPSALADAGLSAADLATIETILDSYDRSNPLNLVAIGALLVLLQGETGAASATISAEPVVEPPVGGTMPELLSLDEMEADTANLVRAVNVLGTRGKAHIMVSMPRHLAHWPTYLELYRSIIAPLEGDGSLAASIDAVIADGRSRGARLASRLSAGSVPNGEARAATEATLGDFYQNAIARMIPVVSILRKALPPT